MDEGDSSVETLFSGGVIVLLGLVLELGISFLGKLVIAPYLGRTAYGSVSLGITTAAIGSTLVLLGLHTGIARYLPRFDNPAGERSILLSGFRIAVPLALLAGIVLYVASPPLAGALAGDGTTPAELTRVLRVFALAVPFGAVMKLAIGTVQGKQTALPKVAIQNVTFPVVRIIAIVLAVLLGGRAFGISLAYLASYVAAAAVGLYFLARYTTLFDRSIHAEIRYRELLSFSLPLVITTAMTIVLSDIDMYMLGLFDGPAVVGDYNVIYPIAELLTTALTAFGFLLLPAISELESDGDIADIRRLFQVVTKWVVVTTLPLFLVVVAFPGRTIALTFGPEYLGGSRALAVLSIGFFVNAALGLNKGALTSIGRTRLVMYDDITGAGVNVLLNLVLIPEYGLLGAAVATTASYILLNGLYSAQLYRRTSIQPLSRSLAAPLVVGAGTLGVVYLLGRASPVLDRLTLIGLFVGFCVLYGVAIVRFGIDSEEIRILVAAEERLGIDLSALKQFLDRFS